MAFLKTKLIVVLTFNSYVYLFLQFLICQDCDETSKRALFFCIQLIFEGVGKQLQLSAVQTNFFFSFFFRIKQFLKTNLIKKIKTQKQTKKFHQKLTLKEILFIISIFSLQHFWILFFFFFFSSFVFKVIEIKANTREKKKKKKRPP